MALAHTGLAQTGQARRGRGRQGGHRRAPGPATRRALVAACAGLLLSAQARGASTPLDANSWIGDALAFSYFVGGGTPFDLGTYTAPPPQGIPIGSGVVTLFYTNSTFEIVNTTAGGTMFEPDFVIAVRDSTAARIAGVQLGEETGFPLPASALRSGVDFLEVKVGQVNISPNGRAVLDVAFTGSTLADPGPAMPVPLPPSLPLLASGLAALACVRLAAGKWRVM